MHLILNQVLLTVCLETASKWHIKCWCCQNPFPWALFYDAMWLPASPGRLKLEQTLRLGLHVAARAVAAATQRHWLQEARQGICSQPGGISAWSARAPGDASPSLAAVTAALGEADGLHSPEPCLHCPEFHVQRRALF